MTIEIGEIKIGENLPLVLIAGPCVIENKEITFLTAEKIKEISDKLNIPFIFKSSFKKANRTSLNSFTGLGFDESIKILEEVKKNFNIPILTDVHSENDIANVSEIVDVLQIPAFLCRQTDLLIAAGKSGKIVNVKKGQFLAPEDMKHVIEKIESTGNKNILLTERGTTFGYHNLVVDMRSLIIMKEFGYPIVMDATHSVQMPSNSNVTGGEPKFIEPLSKAATAVGIDALFLEVHPDPKNALSDAGSQLQLDKLESVLQKVLAIDKVVKGY
ncbi:MAG: 3-deoxy-8-phosphooctulonate synthase [Ignavibacteriae bacterium]|nr:3-deoxy-8-phosphooctulonate synthase [Ignavibacteriota bacterium]